MDLCPLHHITRILRYIALILIVLDGIRPTHMVKICNIIITSVIASIHLRNFVWANTKHLTNQKLRQLVLENFELLA